MNTPMSPDAAAGHWHTTKRLGLAACCLAFMGLTLGPPSVLAAEAPTPAPANPAPAPGTPPAPPPKFRDFNEVVKGTEKIDGLFTLYRTNDILYAVIRSNQLEQPLLAPIAIARGLASAGTPLNFGDEWILVFHRDGDKVQVKRRNIHYQAPSGTPLDKAVQQNYTDSVLMALPIVTLAGADPVIDLAQVFLSDFADLRLGALDRNRTTWHKIKAFPNNLELEVEATYTRPSPGAGLMIDFGDTGVADMRGVTLVIHYSLCKLPGPGYKPRLADHRVGHFISANKNFGSSDPDTPFVRQINRWRLEKADPKAKLSAPKKQLVWWVEDTVPHEYRPYVQEGILEWNKAFEKIGFRDAIGVRWQNERDDFDPEDINYCTFRWITTSATFAMSGLRADPLTGEMIDGDVIFDASWIRYWKTEYAFLVGKPIPTAGEQPLTPLALAEIISPIMATKHGYGLPFPLPRNQFNIDWLEPDNPRLATEMVPMQSSPLQILLNRRLPPNRFASCQCVALKSQEFSLAAMALAAQATAEPDAKLPEEFLGQAIKEVVMHEVGHSLGLRHNFKASTMLPYDQLQDIAITRAKGLSGSVMDYNPINIARKGQKQGDYASTTLGPYDYWAIEYAYKPIEGDEAAELKKIAARSPEHDLAYATDEDMYLTDDPYVNTYDLGSEPLKYGQDRVALAESLIRDLDDNVVRDGESWARLRSAFSVLFGQYGNATYLASSYIGGHMVSRDFKGGKDNHDPIVPVPGAKQREALKFLAEKILSDQAFQFPPRLLRRLTTDFWYHWGNESLFYLGGSIDYSIYDRVLAIQRIVLNQCFNGSVLSRLQHQELQSEPGANPLRVPEVFRTLTDSIWRELRAETDSDTSTLSFSTIRRNLQREHLRRLCALVLGSRRSSLEDAYGYAFILGGSSANVPADARSLARAHLSEIGKRIQNLLAKGDLNLEPTTEAHLKESAQRIQKVLEASFNFND